MECEHAQFHLGFHFSQMGRALSLMFILETGSDLCVCPTLACKKDFLLLSSLFFNEPSIPRGNTFCGAQSSWF